MRLLLLTSFAIACSAPQPPPKPRITHVSDAAPLVPMLASHASAPAPSIGGAHFGVKWRDAIGMIDGADDWATTFPSVTADSIVLSRDNTITSFDRATGATRRSVQVAHDSMRASRAAIVITTVTEEVGLDPTTLAPMWRAPRPDGLVLVDAWLIETPDIKSPHLRLRRAADGHVISELDGQVEHFWHGGPFLAGDKLVLQMEHDDFVVVEIATGAVRWRGAGIAVSVSGGRIAVARSARDLRPFQIVDLDGHELWRVDAASIVLHDDTAYATNVAGEVTAIDLLTNRVVWRRADASTQPFAADADWVYGWSSSSSMVVIDRRTGEVAGHIPVTYTAGFTAPQFDRGPVVWLGHYLFAYGTLASPEPTTSIDVRACLVVNGCPPNSAPLVGATVTLGTSTATTDQRGCFRMHTDVGRAPVGFASTGGTEAGQLAQFDNPFPEAVVLDGSPLTLVATYIGGGCHDSSPGGFP